MAPEIEAGAPMSRGGGKEPYVGWCADVWAYGALVFELLEGKPAFRGASNQQLNMRIVRASHEAFSAASGPAPRGLIKRLLVLEPSSRLPMKGTPQRQPKQRQRRPWRLLTAWRPLTALLGSLCCLCTQACSRIRGWRRTEGRSSRSATPSPPTWRGRQSPPERPREKPTSPSSARERAACHAPTGVHGRCKRERAQSEISVTSLPVLERRARM